jgi:hypothetical protein
MNGAMEDLVERLARGNVFLLLAATWASTAGDFLA